MDFWGSLLGGFMDRKYGVEAENRKRSDQQSADERALMTHLLSADNPRVAKLALTSLLHGADPRQKAKGFRGWVGETVASPYMAQMEALLGSEEPVEEPFTIMGPGENMGVPGPIPGMPVTPPVQPAITTPPPAEGAMGMPPASPVQPGASAPTQATWTQAPPTPMSLKRIAMKPVEAFLPPMKKYRQQAVAKEMADMEADVEVQVANGIPRPQAMQNALAIRMSRRGLGASGIQYGGNVLFEQLTPEEQTTVPNGQAGMMLRRGYRNGVEFFEPISLTPPSLGMNRNAARDQLGFSRTQPLTPDQATQVEQLAKKNAAEAAGGTTAAREEAKNVAVTKRWLTPDQAAGQRVPFGTSMEDLQGITPVTDDQLKRHNAVAELARQIPDIADLVKKVFPSQTGLFGAAKASVVLAGKRASRDPDFARLEEKMALALGNVARVLSAERGVLTEKDATRAQTALSDIIGWTDTQESALAKLMDVEDALRNIAASVTTPGDVLRERQGAPPTPTGIQPPPQTSGRKTFETAKPGEAYFDPNPPPNGTWRVKQ